MTTTAAPAAQAEYVQHAPLEKIASHPDNPRHELGDITDLAASIKEQGVLEPLVVVPFTRTDAAGTTWALIAGHRRYAAAKEAGQDTVPVLVRHDLTTREEQVAAMVIENQHRADLTPIEEGEAYQLLLDVTPSATKTTVAQAVGMPAKRVSERLRLSKLPTGAKAAVHDGQITLADAARIIAIETRHPELVESVTEAAGTNNFNFRLASAERQADTLDTYDQWRRYAQQWGTPVLEEQPDYNSGTRPVRHFTHGITVDDTHGDLPEPVQVGAAHADCPGAAVCIPTDPGTPWVLGWYCTEFADHHVPTAEEVAAEQEQRQQEADADLTDEEIAEKEAARKAEEEAHAARQQLMEDLSAAQTVRRVHFLDVINQGEPALAKWAVTDLFVGGIEEFFTDATSRLGRDLLGLPDEATPETVEAALKRLKIEQLVLLQWFLAHEWCDDDLNFLSHYQLRIHAEADYVAALTDKFGYEWSDLEIEQFGLDEHGHVAADDEEGAA